MSAALRSGALALALACLAAYAPASVIDLSIPGPVLPSRSIPGSVHADVDGDGLLDGIETGESYDGEFRHVTLIVHRNLGTGAFQSSTYPTPWVEQTQNGFGVDIVQAVELSGDDRPDVYLAVNELRSSCVVTDLVTMINDGAGQFQFGQKWYVGPEVRTVLVQDLSGDGLPDMVAVGHDWQCYEPGEEGRLLVWRNLGFGQFGSPTDYPPGTNVPRDPVAIGDLDGNGSSDIVMSGFGQYLPNVGGGSFGIPVPFGPAAHAALWIGVLELSGDTANDIARIHAGGIDEYINNGTGHFTSQNLSTAPVSRYLVRDLNLDGRADFVTSGSGLLQVLVSTGGGYATTTSDLAATQPIVPADLDADGREDLVVVSATDCVVLTQQAGGTFVPSRHGVGSEQTVECTDLDADGRTDVLLTTTSATSILFNEGAGSFVVTSIAAGGSQTALHGDLDVDGNPDLVLRSPGWFRPARNNGDRTFSVLHSYIGTPLEIADADVDTRPDLLCEHPSGRLLVRGLGDGHFMAPRAVGTFGSPLATADFDRDGHLDVLTGIVGQNGFSVVSGLGSGDFGPPRTFNWTDTQAATLREAVVADFDADGALDVAFVRAGRLSVFLNQGPGTLFGPSTNYLDQTFPTTAAAGDFDGDGDLDIVTNGWVDLTLLLWNDGSGNFSGPTYLSAGDPRAFAAADLDLDGKCDLVVRTAANVRVCWGRGDGTFDPSLQVAAIGASYTDRVDVVDLDGDGGMDILLYGAAGLLFMRGPTGRAFQGFTVVPLGFSPQIVRAADLDSDGPLDLVAVSSSADLAVLRQVSGSFEAELTYDALATPAGAVAADWNEDGRPDLLMTGVLFENRTRPPTAITVHDLRAWWSGTGVEIAWRLEDYTALAAIRLLRGEGATGSYAPCGTERLAPAASMRFLDETASADCAYWYRLVGVAPSGAECVLTSIEVQAAQEPWRTRLAGVRQLSSAAIEVRFTLASGPSPVELALYDVRGRRVLPTLHEMLEGGAHVRVLHRRGATQTLARGVYVVHLSAGGVQDAKKIAVLKR